VLVVCHYLVELLIDAPDPIASLGKLVSLGKGLTQALARMRDLTAGSVDIVDGFLLAGFESVKDSRSG